MWFVCILLIWQYVEELLKIFGKMYYSRIKNNNFPVFLFYHKWFGQVASIFKFKEWSTCLKKKSLRNCKQIFCCFNTKWWNINGVILINVKDLHYHWSNKINCKPKTIDDRRSSLPPPHIFNSPFNTRSEHRRFHHKNLKAIFIKLNTYNTYTQRIQEGK